MTKRTDIVVVDEHYQKNYEYALAQPAGKNFNAEFKPELTPKEMLRLGVFGGNYFQAVPKEFPGDWFDVKVCAVSDVWSGLKFLKRRAR